MKKELDLNYYDYDLPTSLIAQVPIKNRDESKLLHLNKITGKIDHLHFHDIISLLKKGDVLVLNDTKVIPARIHGYKECTKAHIEILLLNNLENNIWQVLIKNSRRVKVNDIIVFDEKLLKAKIISKNEDGTAKLDLIYDGILNELLDILGEMPLPPYIHEKLKEKSRYQTVYAKNPGSAAAPTAGLHFTKKLLDEIEKKGIIVCYVTLHVGLGTFKPVSTDNILNHKMHSEYYVMTEKVATILNDAKNHGNKIIAVGTTSTRVLETVYSKYGVFKECFGNTDIFIYPGYCFKAIDSLITNFHLPKSTLMMLVSALSSRDIIMKAYNEAIKNNYRFFSFGDAMFIDSFKKPQSAWKNILEKTKKEKAIIKQNGFKIYPGKNNVMLSAPHAHKHPRNSMYKLNEYNTSNIVKILREYTNCHIVYNYKVGKFDSNYELNNKYKEVVSEYIKNNNIKYFIDIHGMNDNNNYNVEFGTNNGENILNNSDIINDIVNIFKYNGIKRIKVDYKYKAGIKTLSSYISKNNDIPCFQIEIASKYRHLKTKPLYFKKLLLCLEETIKKLEGGNYGRRN